MIPASMLPGIIKTLAGALVQRPATHAEIEAFAEAVASAGGAGVGVLADQLDTLAALVRAKVPT